MRLTCLAVVTLLAACGVGSEEEPDLATSWTVSRDSRSISFQIRKGVKFSDGTPFTPRDVEYTFKQLFDPKLQAPLADDFRSGGAVPTCEIKGDVIKITFGAPMADFVSLFDQLPIRVIEAKARALLVVDPEAAVGAEAVGQRRPVEARPVTDRVR